MKHRRESSLKSSNIQRIRILWAAITVVIILLIPMADSTTVDLRRFSIMERDYWPTDEWIWESPSQHGLDENRLNEMASYIIDSGFQIDSFLIVRHGYMVYEWYFNAYNQDILHPIYSCTKSIVSAAIGIAIDEGFIAGVDEKVLDFFPDRTFENMSPEKENITIEHLLTMSSGLEWHELDLPYSNPSNSFNLFYDSSDWVSYVLDQPIFAEPGTEWNYNSGTSHLLSAILDEVTGNTTLELITPLLASLGLEDSEPQWETDPQGVYFGGSGMQLIPRVMAKFGYLYLNNGSWDGEQLVSQEWVDESIKAHQSISEDSQYGYQWWVEPGFDAYVAIGYAGQYIMVIPSLDMVIVCTSSLYETSNRPFWNLVSDYIIPAVDDMITPDNPTLLIVTGIMIGCVAVVIILAKKTGRI